jgi:RNA polymerase-binding transcription factor DksA
MDTSTARELLTAERARLQEIKDSQSSSGFGMSAEEGGQPTSELDPTGADAGTETFDREMGESLRGHAEAELEEVAAAFQRLDDGTYGRCETCGTDIPDERLEAMPATRYCVEHQRLADNMRGGRGTGDPTATSNVRGRRR